MSMAKRLPISATAELLYKVTTDGIFYHATYRSRQKQAKTLRQMGREVTGQLADCQLADWTTRGLDISQTGQLAD